MCLVGIVRCRGMAKTEFAIHHRLETCDLSSHVGLWTVQFLGDITTSHDAKFKGPNLFQCCVSVKLFLVIFHTC